MLNRRFHVPGTTRSELRTHLGRRLGRSSDQTQMIDSVDVQRCTVARQGDVFAGAWYPDDAYNPYDDAQHLFTFAKKQPTKSPQSRNIVDKRQGSLAWDASAL